MTTKIVNQGFPETIIDQADASVAQEGIASKRFNTGVSIQVISSGLNAADGTVTILGSNEENSGYVIAKDDENNDVVLTLDGTDGSDYILFHEDVFVQPFLKAQYAEGGNVGGTITVNIDVK